jgi:hypothetical protein|tara:strand:+ start:5795 stop:6070 length:276 start_codon:yes stop_codon:yes gene_type:complete
MDEEKQEEQEQETPQGDGEGNEPETTPLIDDANLAAKRMEEANKEKRELLDREEALMAKKALGGNTEAGQPKKEEKIDDVAYAQKALSNDE